MKDFEYQNKTRVIFGKNCENELLFELRKYAHNVLMVYGNGSIMKSGLYEVVAEQIREAGCGSYELGGIKPNPSFDIVEKGINIARENNIDFILAVGGGSVIDTAKAIAFGVYDEEPWIAFEQSAIIQRAMPIGVVLTNAAAGSEVSDACVITNEKTGFKRSVHGECLRPQFSIMNPERTFTVSKYQTACGVADIIAHLFERYFTNENAVELTDRMIEANIKTMLLYGKRVVENPKDYDARAEVMWCGSIAQSGILSCGRMADGASHKIAHEISALKGTPHGTTVAIIFPAWMKYNYSHDKRRFIKLAARVFDVRVVDKNADQIIYEMIAKLETFYKNIGLEIRLKDVGVKEEELPLLAEKAFAFRDTIGEFVQLRENNVLDILRMAY